VGISGWWLVLFMVFAFAMMIAFAFVLAEARERTLEELRNVPTHRLQEKLEEHYLQNIKRGEKLRTYKPKTYKGATYEDDMVKMERRIVIIQDLSTVSHNQSQSQTQTEAETGSGQEESESAGLMKGYESSEWGSEYTPSSSDDEAEVWDKRFRNPWRSQSRVSFQGM
jgi:hypothetical protein